MRQPYLKIAGLVAVAAIGGAAAEASRAPGAAPTLVEEVAGETTTGLCLVTITGGNITINCNRDEVKAFLEDGLR